MDKGLYILLYIVKSNWTKIHLEACPGKVFVSLNLQNPVYACEC